MATVVFDTPTWAGKNFGPCKLGNRKRTRRLQKLATQMANRPEGSTPDQTETWSDCKAAYRLFNRPEVTFQKIIAPHCQLTRGCCQSGDVKLIVCDTTDVDFTSLRKARGLKPIGNGRGRGFFLHTAMMIDVQSKHVDGIAAADIFYRRERKGKKLPNNSQRRRPDRESVVWGRVIDDVGRPPEGVRWVHVNDRGADDIEVMWRAINQGCGFVIRAARLVRKIISPDGMTLPLKDYLATLPAHGTREVKVRPTIKTPARTAIVTLRYGAVDIPLPSVVTPWLKAHRPTEPLHAGVVELLETNPPKGVKPIRWVLYSETPIDSDAQAEVIIEEYEQRPTIEDYHKAAKTGCSMEKRRELTAHALENVVALCIVIAVRLLQLKMAAKETPDRPARELLPLSWIRMLQRVRTTPLNPEITIYDFIRQLAGLGGFLGRKGDGEPGWITLWRGFEKLILMIRGAAAKGIRSG